jgi:hypothetical protein
MAGAIDGVPAMITVTVPLTRESPRGNHDRINSVLAIALEDPSPAGEHTDTCKIPLSRIKVSPYVGLLVPAGNINARWCNEEGATKLTFSQAVETKGIRSFSLPSKATRISS